MKKPVVTLSHYTDTRGKRVWQVFRQATPICDVKEDVKEARQLAEDIYKHEQSAIFVEWNGDTSTETIIKEK